MILVDYREGSIELLEPLRKMGLSVEKGNLLADLFWEGRDHGKLITVGVEYKKLEELVASLRSERLQGHQLPKMRKSPTNPEGYDICYLLVEGEFHCDEKGYLLKRVGRREFRPIHGRMALSELLKRLNVLHLEGGLNLLRATSRPETLETIAALYRTYADVADLNDHRSHIAIYQAPPLTPVSSFRERIVGALKGSGVGYRTSLAVERHFQGRLGAALAAPKSEWLKISGVGPIIADRIEDILNDK